MHRLTVILGMLCVLLMSGCGVENELPDHPVVFEQGMNEEYVFMSSNGKVYVPYCPLERKYLGKCIGYCDIPASEYSDASREYIFEFEGYPSDECIIAMTALNNCDEGMILREMSTTDIPDGLESEYEWNHDQELEDVRE